MKIHTAGQKSEGLIEFFFFFFGLQFINPIVGYLKPKYFQDCKSNIF